MKIGLIACSSKKLNHPAIAEKLYSPSTLFSYALKYCKIHYDGYYILSAKYGLVEPYKVLEPYNITLNTMKKLQRNMWAIDVMLSIEEKIPKGSQIYFHAGEKYREVIPLLQGYEIIQPMVGVGGIGKQMAWYKSMVYNRK